MSLLCLSAHCYNTMHIWKKTYRAIQIHNRGPQKLVVKGVPQHAVVEFSENAKNWDLQQSDWKTNFSILRCSTFFRKTYLFSIMLIYLSAVLPPPVLTASREKCSWEMILKSLFLCLHNQHVCKYGCRLSLQICYAQFSYQNIIKFETL